MILSVSNCVFLLVVSLGLAISMQSQKSVRDRLYVIEFKEDRIWLLEHPAEARHACIEELQQEKMENFVISRCLMILGHVGDVEDQYLSIRYLHHSDLQVRLKANLNVLKLPESYAIPLAEAAIYDDNTSISGSAKKYLESLDNDSSRSALIRFERFTETRGKDGAK